MIAFAYFAESSIENDLSKREALLSKALGIQRVLVNKNPTDTLANQYLSMYLNSAGYDKESLELAEKIGDSWLIVLYLNNSGYSKVMDAKYQEALQIFSRSLSICKKTGFKTLLRNTYDNIGRAYRLMGRLDKAATYMELQHYVEESLFREQFALQASEYKAKIDAEKQDLENKFLIKEGDVLKENIAYEKLQKYLLLFSFIGASFTSVIFFRSRKRIKSSNAKLREQSTVTEQLYAKLASSEENLKNAQITAHLANWEWESATDTFSFSGQLPVLLDIESKELIKNFRTVIDNKVYADDREPGSIIINEGQTNSDEKDYRFIIRGNLRWIKSKRVLTRDSFGKLLYISGTIQDITDIKEEEEIKARITLQRSFTKQLLKSQEEERKRIAGELHDGLGQNILLLKTRAQMNLQNENLDKHSLEQFAQINSETSEILKLVREIAFNLRPAHLERLGLTETIITAINKTNELTEINISENINDIDDIFPAENEINLYRIIQEGVNNILKHSKAENAFVELQNNGEEITISIKDDGVGFPLGPNDNLLDGFGINSIRSRVEILQGRINIITDINKGTILEIVIPIGKD